MVLGPYIQLCAKNLLQFVNVSLTLWEGERERERERELTSHIQQQENDHK